MKVTNWRKKLAAAIVAAGIWVPSLAHAVNIPVGDANFEDYMVPSWNYAYATGPKGAYRPTGSAWVDDLSHNSGNYIQDNASSNYLYNTTYANAYSRGTPHSGSQAMHGFQRYSAQVLIGQTFQAGQTYTLSIWAQNDTSDLFTKGVFMYLFDGSQPFDNGTALASILHPGTAISTRTAGMQSDASKNNWTLLTLPPFTPSAGVVGKPIGVGFFLRRGTSVDDVSLSSVPEPASVMLVGLGGLTLLGLRRRR